MTDAQPTDFDRQRAELRRQIAARQRAEYDDAKALATAALGFGWVPWMKLSLLDADYHKNGNTQPVATAVKVYRGQKALTERSFLLRRMPDGLILVGEKPEDVFPELHDLHPTRTLELLHGKIVPAPAFSLTWGSLEDGYSPQTAEELAAARVVRERNREKRAVEAYEQGNPLLAQAGIRKDDLERGR